MASANNPAIQQQRTPIFFLQHWAIAL